MPRQATFHVVVRSLMSLGARCIVLVLWPVASGLYGVVSRGCHFAGLNEHFRGEGVLWAAGGCFRGLAGQARLARRRAAERCDSASRCLDGGDCCSACFRSRRATVDTDRSNAGGAVVAPRKESGLPSGRWELSALCGRRPFCAGLDGSVVWRVGGGVGLERARRSQAQIVLLGRQGDDTEIGGASSKQVAAWHQQYITVMGAPPEEEEEEEPSADQLQALYHRTMVLGNAPYVDHAVWGPFGRI